MDHSEFIIYKKKFMRVAIIVLKNNLRHYNENCMLHISVVDTLEIMTPACTYKCQLYRSIFFMLTNHHPNLTLT